MSLVLFRQRLRLTEGERSFNYSSAIRDDSTECVCDIMRAPCGSVAERLNAPVLKTGVEKSIVSSNLTGPAKLFC